MSCAHLFAIAGDPGPEPEFPTTGYQDTSIKVRSFVASRSSTKMTFPELTSADFAETD